MNMRDDSENKLDALFAEYRQAYPDPEASAGFMPGNNASVSVSSGSSSSYQTGLPQIPMRVSNRCKFAVYSMGKIESALSLIWAGRMSGLDG